MERNNKDFKVTYREGASMYVWFVRALNHTEAQELFEENKNQGKWLYTLVDIEQK